MKAIVIVTALMLGGVLVSTVEAVPTGKPFLRGVKDPADLARLIESSLKQSDATGFINLDGKRLIDPDLCMKNGSCATANDYLVMFQESDPGAHLTKVSEIPDFLRTLKVVNGPPGEFWVACLRKPERKKGAYTPVLHCISRRFKPGEKAWLNTKTKRIVLASDCTNPVEKEIPPKTCKLIRVSTRSGDSGLRFAIQGPAAVRDDCVAVKRAGQTEFENLWPEECADKRCDFSENAKFMGQPVQLMGSYIPEPGEHVFRVPASFAEKESLYSVAFCLERGEFGDPGDAPKEPARPVAEDDPALYALKFTAYMEYIDVYENWRVRYNAWRDTWISDHSDSINVVPAGYRGDVAVVYYTKEEVPLGMPMVYFPWGEWGNNHPQ